MDCGSVTLLELCQVAHGSRVAFCLTRGEFLFVTQEAPRYFRAASPCDLFGKNLCQYLVPYDLEKLQDYMRAHSHNGAVSNEVASRMTMMVRLVGSGQTLWIRMKTVPLSLRLLRCIDSVTVLAAFHHHFADSSSFVVKEDELSTIFTPSPREPQSLQSTDHTFPGGDEAALRIATPPPYEIPLELKSTQAGCDDCLMSTSPASPTGLLQSLDESLSSLAFEADWDAEVTPTSSGHRLGLH